MAFNKAAAKEFGIATGAVVVGVALWFLVVDPLYQQIKLKLASK
jgi:hypothetical protein